MLVGYARVSTLDQNLNLQIDALTKLGCDKIFEEKTSTRKVRPTFNEMIEYARAGDTIVCLNMTRFARTLVELVNVVNELTARNVNIIFIMDNIRLTNPGEKLKFHMFASFAEFERERKRESTLAGLAKTRLVAARARGRLGGRPRLLTEKQIKLLVSLHENKHIPVKTIYESLKISRQTMYFYLKKYKEEQVGS